MFIKQYRSTTVPFESSCGGLRCFCMFSHADSDASVYIIVFLGFRISFRSRSRDALELKNALSATYTVKIRWDLNRCPAIVLLAF